MNNNNVIQFSVRLAPKIKAKANDTKREAGKVVEMPRWTWQERRAA